MSDQLYNEMELNGKPYVKGDWKTIATHNEFAIKGFFGPYRFLSNFEPCQIRFEGLEYPSSEAAYQAAKTLNGYDRVQFCSASPRESKKLGRNVMLRADWEEIKFDVMAEILFYKFLHHKDLKKMLLETGNRFLEETNWWGDKIWGVDYQTNVGENHLGRMLMKLRALFQHHSMPPVIGDAQSPIQLETVMDILNKI